MFSHYYDRGSKNKFTVREAPKAGVWAGFEGCGSAACLSCRRLVAAPFKAGRDKSGAPGKGVRAACIPEGAGFSKSPESFLKK
ncbi:hypothetical protein [Kamptonema formosum]|uniref:hypothetical protein n=1 Tax=Kamptonema formosum TaxID=331992 RepID=UPI000381A336|nr:hypothetical protein [Oscillatoria sp. PCC 10802]